MLLFAIVIFMDVQYRAGRDFIILHVDILVAVGQIQAAHMATQRQINRLTIVDGLRFGAQRTTKALEICRGTAVINHVDDATDRTIGVHQRRWSADDFNLLRVPQTDIDRMIGPQCGHIANHCAVIQHFDSIATHATNDGLPYRCAKISRGNTQ